LRRIAVAIVGTLLVAGCGVPADSGFEAIEPEDIPFGADDTTTTTTTTTTVPDSTTAPSTPTGSTSLETTTTVVDTEPVELFFVTGSSIDPRLTSITRALSRPASLIQVTAALEEGPPPDIGAGLRSVVPDGLVTRVTERGGIAEIELDDEVFNEVAGGDQDSLVAQLVLTLGNRPGVGQVLFTREGEPFLIRVPSRGNILSDQPVAADDFESLLLDAVIPPPTSPTTTSIDEPPPEPTGPPTTEETRRTTTTTTATTTTTTTTRPPRPRSG
jgi:spore germination protein GerM